MSLVSVVVPVLDGERTLAEQLDALAGQRFGGAFEVVIVDNGSRDRSLEIAAAWAGGRPRRRVVVANERRGGAYARNAGVAASAGELIAFCDADDVVDAGWLEALVAAAGDADLVAGRNEFALLNSPLVRSWHEDAPADRPPQLWGQLPFASSANCCIWRDVFEAIGGFDETTVSGEDADLSWRAQSAARTLAFAPDAVVHYRYRSTPRALARQFYKYGWGDAWLHARHGMRAEPPRAALRRWLRLVRQVRHLRRSPTDRGRWLALAALSCGRLAGSVSHRTLFL